jgi:hypothetical protein
MFTFSECTEAGLLNKSLSLATAYGVIKFTNVSDMSFVTTFLCFLSWTWMFNKDTSKLKMFRDKDTYLLFWQFLSVMPSIDISDYNLD